MFVVNNFKIRYSQFFGELIIAFIVLKCRLALFWWCPCCSSFYFVCVVLFALLVFVLYLVCVPNVACASGLSILDFLFGFL
ncbi:membrane protein [Bathymodiolus azoricus thioautotrophic gill symbiont]|uniref:Membrane protein n=1 Tax=Bathymodiolus azoricus thioautotrophic gill symbiont TaxID=235205 RepID=A0A1H6KGN3_9GAMM|nr:membrane protein [Bathymodiolus azoricus thioautotrophic gill symbiont]